MNQFDKKKKICLNIFDIESIKKALKMYKTLLDSDDVIDTSDFTGLFDVEFVVASETGSRRLQVSDTKHVALVKEALDMGPDGGPSYYPERIEETCELYISEVLFFAIALEHLDLKNDVIETAQAMVDFSRRKNDGSDMWVDDMRVFGVEALYLLAKVYPEYTYLLAQFLIPYWDDEHAVGYEAYLRRLVLDNGWTEANIKAFIWCDNTYFRQAMNTEECVLGEYLKQNPDAYTFFKDELKSRLMQQPVLLPYEDSVEDISPIYEIFFSLMAVPMEWAVERDENEALLEAHFISDSLENEALQLDQIIRSEVKTPLSTLSASTLEKKQLLQEIDDYFENYKKGDVMVDVLDLCRPLDRGGEICHYIATGEGEAVLETITPVDFVTLTKTHVKNLYYRVYYYTGHFRNNDEVLEAFSDIMSDLTSELLMPEDDWEEDVMDNGTVLRTLSYGVNETPFVLTDDHKKALKEKYLRILDVFYRLLGKKMFSEEVQALVVNSKQAPLISEELFFVRYGEGDAYGTPEEQALRFGQKKAQDAVKAFTDVYAFEMNTDHMKKADQMHLHRDAITCESWQQDTEGAYALAAYLLNKDFNARIGDAVTQKLIAFLSDGMAECFANHFLTHLENEGEIGISLEEKKRLERYFTLSVPEISREEALTLLKQYLWKEEERYSEEQAVYSLFWNREVDTQRMILTCFWLSKMPLPISVIAKRIWLLCLDLAPQKTIQWVTVFYTDYYGDFDGVLEEIEHFERLEKSGVPLKQSLAFQMTFAQNNVCRLEEKGFQNYRVFLDLYDEVDSDVSENSLFGGIEKKKAMALAEGMAYIKETQKIAFYKHLSYYNPRFPFDQSQAFEKAVKRLIKHNLASLPTQITTLFEEEEILFNGSSFELPKTFTNMVLVNGGETLGYVNDFEEASEPILILQMCETGLRCMMKPEGERFDFNKCPTLEELKGYVHVIILNPMAKASLIEAFLSVRLDERTRVEQVTEGFLAYMNGQLCFDKTLALFSQNVERYNFKHQWTSEEGQASVIDFMGAMSEEQFSRMIRLLTSHSIEAFDLLKPHLLEEIYLERQVLNDELEFDTYFRVKSEGVLSDDQVIGWLLEKIIAAGTTMKTVFKLVVKLTKHYEIKSTLVQLMANEGFAHRFECATNAEKRCILTHLEDI